MGSAGLPSNLSAKNRQAAALRANIRGYEQVALVSVERYRERMTATRETLTGLPTEVPA